MRGCLYLAAALALGACGDEAIGTRGTCASGGTINECAPFPETPQGACEKYVACGLLVRDDPNGGFDWGECVNEIQSLYNDGTAEFVIDCALASSCDELATGYCFRLGDLP
jgi:hypothetical protein